MSFHTNLTDVDIHVITRWTVADAAARTGLSVVATDVDRVCRQTDNDSYWVLLSIGPPIWKELTTTAGASSLITKDHGTLVSSSTQSYDFVGNGVVITAAGDDITVDIAGISGAQSLQDVITTAGGGTIDNDLIVPTSNPVVFRDVGSDITPFSVIKTTATATPAIVVTVPTETTSGVHVEASSYMLDITPGGVLFDGDAPASYSIEVSQATTGSGVDLDVNAGAASGGGNSGGDLTLTGGSGVAGATSGTVNIGTSSTASVEIGGIATPVNVVEHLVVAGNISVSGTVDGVNVSSFKAAYDTHIHPAADLDATGVANDWIIHADTDVAVWVSPPWLADMAGLSVKGNLQVTSAPPVDVNGTQLTTLLDPFTSTLQGVVPGSGGGTSNYLRADGTWFIPAGSTGRAELDFGAGVWTIENTTGADPVAVGGFSSNFADPTITTQLKFYATGDYNTGGLAFLSSLDVGDRISCAVPDSTIVGGEPPTHVFLVDAPASPAGNVVTLTVTNEESNGSVFDTVSYGFSVTRGKHIGLYSPVDHAHEGDGMLSTGELVDYILVTDGFDGFTYEQLSATGHGAGSIDQHGDVDTSTITPNPSEVLGWNGANWVPQAASTPGGHDLGGSAHTSPDGGGDQTAGRIVEADGTGGVQWADTVESVIGGDAVTVSSATGDVTLDVAVGNSVEVVTDALEVKIDGTTSPVTLAIGASGIKVADLGIDTGSIAASAVTVDKLDANAVTNAKLAQMPTLTMKGNAAGITADPTDLVAADIRTISGTHSEHLGGDVTGTEVLSIGTDKVLTAHILAENVTNAKLAQMPTLTMKGNLTGGAAVPTDLVAADVRTISGTHSEHLGGDVTGTENLSIGADKVLTAHILDDNVTLAKMKAGTPGGVIAYDTATGIAIDVGAGALNQVLTTSTVGSPPTWQPPVGGAVDSITGGDGLSEDVTVGDVTLSVNVGDGIETVTDNVSVKLDGGTTIVRSASGIKVGDLGIDTGQIALAAVTNDKLADMAQNTIKGNDAVLGVPKDLISSEVTAILDEFDKVGVLKGVVPGTSGATSANYLDASGNWSEPPGVGITGINLEEESTPVTDTPHITLNFLGDTVTVENVDGDEATITVDSYGTTANTIAAGDHDHAAVYAAISHAAEHELLGSDLIDHDNLTNYLPAEHVDWSLAAAGTIHTDNYIENDPNSVTAAAVLGNNLLIRGDGVTRGVQTTGITIADTTDDISGAGLYNGVDVEAHASRHENTGVDEINVTDLSGLLADPQTAGGIKTDTSIVAFATATAPTPGQVLEAINSTSAAWATLDIGSTARIRAESAVNVTTITANTLITSSGGSSNTDAALLDYETYTFDTDLEIYINGRLMRNGTVAGSDFDVYPSAITAEQNVGAFYCEFDLQEEDTIQMFYGTGTGGGSGVSTFEALTDTETLVGQDDKWLRVNPTGDGVTYGIPAGAGDVVSAEGVGDTLDGEVVVFDDADGKNVRRSTNITEAVVQANTDHIGTGDTAHALATTGPEAHGFMSGADKTKLFGIEALAKDDQVVTGGNGITVTGSGDVTLSVDAEDATILVGVAGVKVGEVQTANIAAEAVTNIKLADMAQNTFKGNDLVLGAPKDLNAAEATAILSQFSIVNTDQGVVPGTNGVASSNYLDASGTWSTPAGITGINLQEESTPVTDTPHITLNFLGDTVTVENVDGDEATITVDSYGTTANTIAAGDHDHAAVYAPIAHVNSDDGHPIVVAGVSDGFMTAAMATTLAATDAAGSNRPANEIATSGTNVTISGTAPSAGQILKADSPTAASWQADDTGGAGYADIAALNADISPDQAANIFITASDPVASAVDGDIWIDTTP